MLSYFGKYLQQRIFLLGLIYLAIRLVYAYLGIPTTVLQVLWKQTGMALFNGEILYHSLYTDIAPIPAGIYALLEFAGTFEGGLAFLTATALMGWQAYLFTQAGIKLGLFYEKNYIPGLVYVLLGSICFQFTLLSPELLASTFLMAMLNKMASHLKEPLSTDEILSIGFLVSLSSLCYLPSALFLAVPFIAFLLYTGTTFQQYFLIILGFIIPIALVILGYYMVGMGTDIYYNYLLGPFVVNDLYLIPLLTLISFLLLPAVLIGFGIINTLQSGRFINYQRTVQVSYVLYLIVAIPVIIFGNTRWLGQYIFLLPVAAVFITNLFMLLPRNAIAELSFLVTTALLLTFGYLSMLGTGEIERLANFSEEIVKPVNRHAIPKGSSVLVFGTDYSYYHQNKLATPFLNTDLSKRVFSQTKEYETILFLYRSFADNPPQVIIGGDSILTDLFKRMPVLARKYEKQPQGNVYLLKVGL